MVHSRYEKITEVLSPEARADVEITRKVEGLLEELESRNPTEERRKEIAGEIRENLKRYHQIFGKGSREIIDGYHQKLKVILEK
ncbi:MAG: hypothetical protein ACOZAG_02165 [Patescibacteria group bacterium]